MEVISWKNMPIFHLNYSSANKKKTQFHMVKGIIIAFDHMELSWIINLTKGGNWAIQWPPIFATGYVSFATTFLYQVAITC